jgi:hypothetical protein
MNPITKRGRSGPAHETRPDKGAQTLVDRHAIAAAGALFQVSREFRATLSG